jgi:hypothetical protein
MGTGRSKLWRKFAVSLTQFNPSNSKPSGSLHFWRRQSAGPGSDAPLGGHSVSWSGANFNLVRCRARVRLLPSRAPASLSVALRYWSAWYAARYGQTLRLPVAVLVVAVRRWLRPPRSVLEDTFIDVSAGGVLRRRQHLVPCFWQVHRSAERNCDPLSGVPAGRRGRIRLTPPSRTGQAQRLTRARQRIR